MQRFLNNNSRSVYIHVPFCVKKCNYCNFISFTSVSAYEDIYVDALCREIAAFKNDNFIETVYLGGGTPNILKINSLEKIISALKNSFVLSDNAEFSMEFNPKLSDRAYIKSVEELGINRISLGAQSFNDDILKTLGRIHNVKDTLDMVDILNSLDISNYSLDLIYGVFGQSMELLKSDLLMIKQIYPKHVSTYGLKIEKGTPFYSYSKANLPDEDLCADMYLMISDELRQANYEHYEISNFAREGTISKHNMTYWKNNEYYGFGTSAHGYLNKIRYKNADNIAEYIENPLRKIIISENERTDVLEEKIMLGLRTSAGINLEDIKKDFGFDLASQKSDFLKQIISSEHAVLAKNKLSLTEKGFLISNYIIAELMP